MMFYEALYSVTTTEDAKSLANKNTSTILKIKLRGKTVTKISHSSKQLKVKN